jgi:large repetitive protein
MNTSRREKNNLNLTLMIFAVFLIVSSSLAESYADTTTATGVAIIASASITVNPTAGPGGEKVTVTGSNFLSNQQINIIFRDAINHSYTLGNTIPGSTNSFTIQVTVPYAAYPGSATISAQRNHVTLASKSFTIPFPTITLDPTSGADGTQVTVIGSGFALNQKVSLYIGPSITHGLKNIGKVTTDGSGAFSTQVTIPSDNSAGVYFISVREDINRNVYAAAAFTVPPTATTTTISSSHNPSTFGQSVTFTATVSPVSPAHGMPTGSVTFIIDGRDQLPVILSGGKATLILTTLSSGNHQITAQYSGDPNFASSTSSTLTQTVNQASSKTTLTSSANPSKFGNKVAFTVMVSPVPPASGTPTGSVIFTIDGVNQPVVMLTNGQATTSSSSLSVGSHTISAKYSGDTNFGTSSSSVLVQKITQ